MHALGPIECLICGDSSCEADIEDCVAPRLNMIRVPI